MLFRRRKDIVQPTAQPSVSATSVQTITFRIKQEQRRLDGIQIRVGITAAATTTFARWGGAAGIVKEIRVRVNDVLGTRNAVQVSGVGLLSYVRENLGNLDRTTQSAYGATSSATDSVIANTFGTANFYVTYFVPFRHPLVEDPAGNYLSLPLSQKFMGDDVIVEVDFNIAGGTSGPVFGTAAITALDCYMQTIIREVDESYGYIPSELRTDYFQPSSTASPAYEFTSNGYLSGFLLQGFSANPLAIGTTRSAILGSGGQFRIEYGREILMRDDQAFSQAFNDLSKVTYPDAILANIASSALYTKSIPNEVMFDLLSDLPGNSAFSVASIPNLYTSALGGDKFRIIFNDYAATTTATHITQHRLLPKDPNDLKALAVSI